MPLPTVPFRPSPGSKFKPGSFSLVESPPQSSFVSSPAARLSPCCKPTEVSALIAASPGASTCHERFHPLVTFRPQAFAASRRFAPRLGFAGLFHPASHVQGSTRPGASSLRTAALGLPSPCPLAVGRLPLTPSEEDAATSGCLGFEALLRAKMRAFDLVLPEPNVAPLIGFPSSGCVVSNLRRRLPAAIRP